MGFGFNLDPIPFTIALRKRGLGGLQEEIGNEMVVLLQL